MYEGKNPSAPLLTDGIPSHETMRSLFATTSEVKPGSGGGIVSYNIALALKEATNLVRILCDGETDIAKSKNINPTNYAQPNVPFLWDYFATQFAIPVDIAHFRGDPFGLTAEKIKFLNPNAKIIVDVPAHNLELSIEEFHRWGYCYPFLHMLDDFLWKIYASHVGKADVVVVPSTLSAKYVELSKTFRKVFLHKPEIKIIPHGTELPKEIPPKPDDKFRVIHLGACGFDKGQIYLLQAWKKLNLKDAELLIAGYGTESWDVFIKSNKIENAYALGKLDDLKYFYSSGSIYVQPSVTEGWGLPVGEAMAYGKPVIVTEGTGAKDMVTENYNGFVVPIRSPDAIAEKIQYFYDNPNEIRRMGRNARTTAINYEWSRIRKRYIDLYKSFEI